MDMLDHYVFHRRQVVLQFIRAFDHCSAVFLTRVHRRDGSDEARTFDFAVSPGANLSMGWVKNKNHSRHRDK